MAPAPVSGAVVGYAVLSGAEVCEAAWVGAAVAGFDAAAVAELVARDELGTSAELDADAAPRAVAVAPVDDFEFGAVGDGVRVPDCEEEFPFVCGVGVKTDGTDEPPPEQAETATATRTAPATERPAVSHAPWAVMNGVRRIFMNTLLECVSDKFCFP